MYFHYKQWSLKYSRHFKCSFEIADSTKQIITQADFHRMNQAGLLDLVGLVKHKAKKKSALRFHYLVLTEHLNALIHYFGSYSNAPPLLDPSTSIKGLGDVDYGVFILEPMKAVRLNCDEDIKTNPIDQLWWFLAVNKHQQLEVLKFVDFV
ncbi:hypothetical protein LXL04_022468 [Taraxacum kok-saghyz]